MSWIPNRLKAMADILATNGDGHDAVCQELYDLANRLSVPGMRFDSGDWFYTDAFRQTWRLVPTHTPDRPFTILLMDKGEPYDR